MLLAPNFSILQAKKILGENAKILRAMPNTPAAIGWGANALCYENLEPNEQNCVRKIFENFGRVYEID